MNTAIASSRVGWGGGGWPDHFLADPTCTYMWTLNLHRVV